MYNFHNWNWGADVLICSVLCILSAEELKIKQKIETVLKLFKGIIYSMQANLKTSWIPMWIMVVHCIFVEHVVLIYHSYYNKMHSYENKFQEINQCVSHTNVVMQSWSNAIKRVPHWMHCTLNARWTTHFELMIMPFN